MAKTYNLKVDIEAKSTLQDQIKELERLVALKNELKGTKIELFSDEDIKGLSEFAEKNEQVNKSIKKQKIIIDDIEKAELKLAKAQTQHAKNVAEINLRTQEQNKANKQSAKENLGLVTAYDKLSQRLIKQKREVKDLIAAGKELSAADRALIKDTQELDAKLKAIDKTVGDNQREVGNYKDKIKEAFQETGLFNTGIGRLLITLKNLQKQMKENSKEGVKFKDVLKGIGVGLAVVAIGLLVKALTAGVEAAQSLTDVSDRLAKETMLQLANAATGTFESMSKINTAITNLFTTIKESRPVIRGLTLDIEKLKRDQEDFNEISADTTIGFEERNIALEESIKLGEKIAELELERANLSLKVISEEIKTNELAVGVGNARADLYEKQIEALLKVDEAERLGVDLIRRSAAATRERRVEEAVAAVELLRSKKLSFDQATAQLEKQLADEKNQLEERRKIANELLKIQNETTKEEIKLFKEKTGIQFNEQKLLNETDAIKLANQLKSIKQINEEGIAVGIGETAIQQLAKIVKEYQENRIKNGEDIKKLDEEEIKRTQRLEQINRDIAANQLAFDIKDRQDAINATRAKEDKNQKELLESDNVFNRKKLKLREISIKQEQNQRQQLFDFQAEQLDKQAQNDRINIQNSVFDEKVKAEETRKINEKLYLDLSSLQGDFLAETVEAEKRNLEELEEITKKRTQLIVEQADFAVDVLDRSLEKQSEKRLSAIDKDIEAQERSLELQQSRAERGLANTLELEQEKAAQLEIERQKELKKEERRQKILTYYSLLSGYAKQDPDTALQKAFRDIAISEGITAAFAEKGGIVGEVTDTTTINGNSLSKSHGSGNDRLIVADKREGILTVGEMATLGRDGFLSLKAALANPVNDDIMFPKVPVFMTASNDLSTMRLESKISELIQVTKNKPVSHTKMDSVGNAITTTFEQGKKHIVKTITSKPKFRR